MNALIHELDEMSLEYLSCLKTCSGTVADLIFHLKWKFGHGLTCLGKEKDRVIAKTIFSPSFKGNNAMTLATTYLCAAFWTSYSNDTLKTGCASPLGNTVKFS